MPLKSHNQQSVATSQNFLLYSCFFAIFVFVLDYIILHLLYNVPVEFMFVNERVIDVGGESRFLYGRMLFY